MEFSGTAVGDTAMSPGLPGQPQDVPKKTENPDTHLESMPSISRIFMRRGTSSIKSN
jgi:hypothetical protein